MLSRQVLAAATRAAPSRAALPIASLRTYATAPAGVDTKPPIPLYGVDGTYASALYTAAVKQSALDSTSKALANIDQVLKNDAKLPSILSAPSLSANDRLQIVEELHKHAGTADKGDTVKNFLKTLAENNRLGILEGVCDKFTALMSAARGEVELTITSAAKLDPKTLYRLEAAVAKSEYSQGKRLKVVSKVNPDIVGGLIVEIGDRTIDLSVSSKVSKMNKLLTDAL